MLKSKVMPWFWRVTGSINDAMTMYTTGTTIATTNRGQQDIADEQDRFILPGIDREPAALFSFRCHDCASL